MGDTDMNLRGVDLAAGMAGSTAPTTKKGISVTPRFMSKLGLGTPFDSVEWEYRSAEIKKPTGEIVFKADNLEFPKSWSHNATALVAEKYFRHVPVMFRAGLGTLPSPDRKVRETSVREMIDRVSRTISAWGVELGYFPDVKSNGFKAPHETFRDELAYILVNQMAAFNSPVWFNVGTNAGKRRTEQCSACFINSVDDNMKSILDLGITEGKLYKGGSGSGVNYSNLRSSREKLSGGGYASGPVPFIAKDDGNAGAIKSGGTTRRAAKMAILNADHGDIFEFVRSKSNSEKAAHALIDAGFDGDFRARWGAYQLVPFQNANHSVRVTDAFMQAVDADGDWHLIGKDNQLIETIKARKLWDEICEAAYICGDPGLQFDTTINRWHTSPANGRINSSNPCSEYMFLDDTACNLASINLLKFMDTAGKFDFAAYEHTIDVMITAMEIIVDGAGYPTQLMQENSTKYRTLGLGYSNLGALLMSQGIAYDSDAGRAQAAYLTAILSGRAYARSAEIAGEMGIFEAHQENATEMLRVMRMHQDAVSAIAPVQDKFKEAAADAWSRCLQLGQRHGYRNAQISVLAPAGTISFLMDCDTTGIEPELSLVKTKKLVGGGTITIVNQQVVRALQTLDYTADQIASIQAHVLKNGSVVGSVINVDHLPIFDSSFPEKVVGRYLKPDAHILMMGAVQPFVSGAISKTCNIPNDATTADISRLYKLAWEKGLKAVALYRDGSKRTQPLQARDAKDPKGKEPTTAPAPLQTRRKLPTDVMAHRHKFRIGQHEGYIFVGPYLDGKPGEVFIKMAKEGSTVSGLMDGIGILTSIALQYGVPLEVLVEKFSYTSFEPAGHTDYPAIRFARSPLDYLFRWLGSEFGEENESVQQALADAPSVPLVSTKANAAIGLICAVCGNTAQRAGSCTTCSTCGSTSGCG